MSSKKKKILSALLASSMLVSQVSVVAFADETETGEGSGNTDPSGGESSGTTDPEEGNEPSAPTADSFNFTAPDDLTYSGQAKSAKVAWKDEDKTDTITVKYAKTDAGEDGTVPEDLTDTAPTNVGTYYVYACVEKSETVAAANVNVGNFTITAKTVTALISDIAKQTYTGEEIKPEITVSFTADEQSVELKKDTDYTVSYTSNTAVGENTASVKVSPKDGSNYIFTEVEKKFTIKKADSKITKEPSAVENLTYNENEQALVTAGETSDGTLKYSLEGNGGFNEAIPTGTKAGEYTVYYKVVGDDSHNDSEVKNVKVTISKATPTVTANASQNIAKGSEFTAPTEAKDVDNNNLDGTFTYSYKASEESEAITNLEQIQTAIKELSAEATATISYTFTPNDTNNYENATGTITVTIQAKQEEEKTFTVSCTAENVELYKGETKVEESTTFKQGETLTIKPAEGYTLSEVKVGETTVEAGEDGSYTYTFTGNETTEALTVTATATKKEEPVQKHKVNFGEHITVKKGEETLTTGAEVDENTELIITVNAPEGKKITAVKNGNTTLEAQEDGTYKVTVSHEDVSITVEFGDVVETITPTLTIKSGDYVYTGEEIKPEITVKNGDVELVVDTDYTVEYENNTNAGTATVTVKPAENGKYSFEAISDTFEIAKAKLTATGDGKASGTYGAKLSALNVSGLTVKFGENEIEGSWKITGAGSDEVPNVGDSAKYTATFTPNDGKDNFEPLTEDVTVIITKAKYTDKINDTEVSFNRATSGAKTVQLALPVISGFEITEAKAAAEGVSYITELSCDKTGKVSFEITANTDSEVERTSTEITVTLSSNNYEDITAKVKITFTEAEDQEAPTECKMTYTADENGTYTVTIETVDGAEYSFDGTSFSENNTKNDVAAGTTVTGYIRYAKVDANEEAGTTTKNASPATSATITTPKAASDVPTITKGTKFKDSIEVTITATDTAATIYYTTDGSNPTTSSTKYTGAFMLTKTTTVKAIAVSTGKEPSEVVSATFTKESSSTGGGSSSGGSRPSGGSSGGSSYTVTDEPTVDGKEKSWTDVAKDIEKLPAGKEMTIELNGDKKIPADVIKAIAKANAKVNVKVDDVFSWTIDGSEINEKDAKAIDLTVAKTSVSGTSALRGALGTSFKLNGTNAESELNIKFKSTHAGKFANVFKKVDGKLVFVDNVKIDKDGNAVGLDISEKGEYVVMLGEFSDRAGDMNNDGILNAKDALAVLKDSAKLEKGANPLVSDLNGDGYRNAKDALIILKMAAGLL